MLQESAGAILKNSFKAIGFVVVILYKFIIVPIVIPAVQHGIKHGWIYVPLGIAVSVIFHLVVHDALYTRSYSTAIAHVVSIPVYILCIVGGVKLMQWKKQKNEQEQCTYINPDAPEDLYEEFEQLDDYYEDDY